MGDFGHPQLARFFILFFIFPLLVNYFCNKHVIFFAKRQQMVSSKEKTIEFNSIISQRSR